MVDGTDDPYRVEVCTRKLDGSELDGCVAIIRDGGAVDVNSDKLRSATVLALAKKGNEIVGVGSVKRMRAGYAAGIAKKSGFDFPPGTLEVGYVAVDAAHRGSRLSHRLVRELLSHRSGGLFATTDNEYMKRTLAAAGFAQRGREWKGRRGQLSLWIKS